MIESLFDCVPSYWARAKVGDVAEGQSGFPCGQHNSLGDGVPHLRPMNVDTLGRVSLGDLRYVPRSISRLRLEIGDVLFNNTNSAALVGKTAYFANSGEFAFSNHMTRLRVTAAVRAKFLAMQLHWLWMRGFFKERCTNHVNQASISTGSLLKSVPIVLPPLTEQRRIVDIVEEQFSRLEVADAALHRALRNTVGLGALVFDGAARAAGEHGTLPLGEVAEVISGPAFTSKDFCAHGDGVRLLRGENIEPGALRWAKTKTWPEAMLAGYEHLFVSKGDIILGMDRPIVSAGLKLAHVTAADLPALLVQRVARIRPGSNLNSAFLFLVLKQSAFVQHVLAGQTGTQLPHITLAGIRSFLIPALSARKQEAFVAEVERSATALTSTRKGIARASMRSAHLRHSVLRAAFNGELSYKFA